MLMLGDLGECPPRKFCKIDALRLNLRAFQCQNNKIILRVISNYKQHYGMRTTEGDNIIISSHSRLILYYMVFMVVYKSHIHHLVYLYIILSGAKKHERD